MDALFEARAAAWLDAVSVRRSRRRYDGAPVDTERLEAIEVACEALSARAGARVALLRQPPKRLFTGIVGGYGKVTGAPHALAVIIDPRVPGCQRQAGYAGEAAILEATALALDTCWVGGFFDPRIASAAVRLDRFERVVAVSPVGQAVEKPTAAERTMRRMAHSSGRKPLAVIAPGIDGSWPAWAVAAVECARLAPSAMNRQPWRFRLEGAALVVARDSRREAPRVTKALDCGIATLHAELAAHAEGVSGEWIDLDAPLDVARFEPGEAV